MNVLGISGLHNSVVFKRREMPQLAAREYRMAQGFDAAAALVSDAGVVAAAAEERFSREKGTGAFPKNAIQYCLDTAGISADNVECLAHSFSYERFRSHFDQSSYARKCFEEVYSQVAQLRAIETHLDHVGWKEKFVPVPHHLAHAASTFYMSGFPEALILVADGMGEIDSLTVARGEYNDIKVLNHISASHSLGILYGAVTHFLGFQFGLDEYKVMGLAPYGNPSWFFARFMEFIRLGQSGKFTIPLLAEDKTPEEKETHAGITRRLAQEFGPPREPDGPLTRRDRDIASALQQSLNATLMHVLRHQQRETGLRRLCLAGGVALNCTANGVIHRSRLFKNLFVQPASGDDGSALGAALLVHHRHSPPERPWKTSLPFWGPKYDSASIEQLLNRMPEVESTQYGSFKDLAAETARRLADGQIVGWFQGRMEFGPRALGNRSILADPRDVSMRERLNQLIKKRENFRPFAPAVIAEEAGQIFDINKGDETLFSCMLLTTHVRAEYRSLLPAVTHVDGSARVQVVARPEATRFWTVLSEFGRLSGMPVLLNTSLNVRGEPIVCSPADALRTFVESELDALVIENFLVVHAGRPCNPASDDAR